MHTKKILSKKWSSCPTELCDVRCNIKKICGQLKFTEEDTNTIVLAIDEACTNIIRYSYDNNSSGEILIEVFTSDKDVIFRLHDHGKKASKDCMNAIPTADLEPGGLGIQLMKQIMDTVHFIDIEECPGNILEMIKERPKGVSHS